MKMNHYLWSDSTNESMNLAFNKKQSDLRKDWLYQYNEKQILNSKETEIPVEKFIHRELIHFSNSDTKRSIGSLFDGLKPSQRKRSCNLSVSRENYIQKYVLLNLRVM